MAGHAGAPRRGAWLVLAGIALALGASAWLWGRWSLPARTMVRGHLGDVAAAVLVYALLGLTGRTSRGRRLAFTAAIALGVELVQARVAPGGGLVRELTLGAHFDPWDLVAYGLGILAAVGWEGRFIRS